MRIFVLHESGALMMIHVDDIFMTAPSEIIKQLQADISKDMKFNRKEDLSRVAPLPR